MKYYIQLFVASYMLYVLLAAFGAPYWVCVVCCAGHGITVALTEDKT